MEELKYIIEDSTIAELLGNQNFINKESAILELVKNSYDAKASKLIISIKPDIIVITDDGAGMDSKDIKSHWMHIGKSSKQYETIDFNDRKRVLSGSKGVGRFALSRLGKQVAVYSKKKNADSIVWKTDWNSSTISEEASLKKHGTIIEITELRDKWGPKAIKGLSVFLSKTYNDDAMRIEIHSNEETISVSKYFPDPQLGINCLSYINMVYNSTNHNLKTVIKSDEFLDKAKKYYKKNDLYKYEVNTNILEELKSISTWDLSPEELSINLNELGDFSASLLFNVISTSIDMEKFMYKYTSIPNHLQGGVILYRNAFSISSYEGKKDWLGLGKRTRQSPAAASHPTGAWRVRENQVAGKVEIDKKNNHFLQDLANRQGLDENIHYELFVKVILAGIKEFERYRQDIIRSINKKTDLEPEEKKRPISEKLLSNPSVVSALSKQEAQQLVTEIKTYRKESSNFKSEKIAVEERYKYDVRILNVLATTGLKASSIAHEMRNDRNFIADNSENIILALKEYGMWEKLTTPERTNMAYKNVPELIESNRRISNKIITFMDTMMLEIEKKQFEASLQSLTDILNTIKSTWERDYSWITINILIKDDIYFSISEDIVRVILDNLILNSLQQNERKNHLTVDISIKENGRELLFVYSDDGNGLSKKYLSNPRKILEVHETTRKNGHGLGMWIVNNTVIMSGGTIFDIQGSNGFSIEFSLGEKA